MSTFVFTERTTLFFTIMTFVLLGGKIYADKAFSMAQYFNVLQCTMATGIIENFIELSLLFSLAFFIKIFKYWNESSDVPAVG